ncbi:MAG: hypothetical protein WAV15_00505 [Minisyncoccia bacterium]
MNQSMFQVLDYNWDFALSPSDENPYPLAPKDLLEKGLVNPAYYAWENERWERRWGQKLWQEVRKIKPGHIEYFGWGLGRDGKKLVPKAVAKGHSVAITDCSTVACKNATEFVEEEGLAGKVTVRQADILNAWASRKINPKKTNVIIASQIFQNETGDRKWLMMRWLGNFLATPPFSRRVAFIIHARGEDNPEGTVEWRHTIPWTDEELFAGLEFEMNEAVPGLLPSIKVVGQHNYFHQKYTLFRITAA